MPLTRRRKIILFIVSVLAICCIGYLASMLFAFASFGNFDFDPMAFDSATWKANPSEFSHDSIRLRMVDDFLSTYCPVQKSRAEIIALLGEPDQTNYFCDYDMVYHLGVERSAIAIDSEWLVFRLNSANIVTEARLATD